MKSTFEFELPEEQEEWEIYAKAHNLCFTLFDFDQYLRSKIRHSDDLSEEAYQALVEARKMLFEIASERGVKELF